MHKINFIWPQKLPVPLACKSLYIGEKNIEGRGGKGNTSFIRPSRKYLAQAGLEVVIELNSVNTCLRRKLGFFSPLKSPLRLDLPLLTEPTNVQEERAEAAGIGDGLKASLHLASPLQHTLQLKWGENFPHFPYFF